MESSKTEKLFEKSLDIIDDGLSNGVTIDNKDVFNGALKMANMHVKIRNREQSKEMYSLARARLGFDIAQALAENKTELKNLLKRNVPEYQLEAKKR